MGCGPLKRQGYPAALVARLSREVKSILEMPSAQTTARALTATVTYEDEDSFARLLAAESANWKRALASLNLSN